MGAHEALGFLALGAERARGFGFEGGGRVGVGAGGHCCVWGLMMGDVWVGLGRVKRQWKGCFFFFFLINGNME